jgi:hypothetical protein
MNTNRKTIVTFAFTGLFSSSYRRQRLRCGEERSVLLVIPQTG